MKKITTVIIFTICLFHKVYSQTKITATVNPAVTGNVIPEDFIGMSHEMSDIGQTGNLYLDSMNTQFVNYHKSLGVKSFRIGANLVDYSKWFNGPRTATTPNGTLTTTDVDKFFGFMKKVGCKAIFGLNFAGTFDPNLAADEVDYILKKHPIELSSFEIGNEPDNYHFHNDLKPTSYYYGAWKPEYAQYIDAIYKKVPKAPISGPSTAYDYVPFTKPYSIDFKGKYNLLTHHNYGGKTRTIDAMLGQDTRTFNINLANALNSYADGKGFRITEMGSFAGGGQAGVSDVFASSLWALDIMYYYASLNCKGVNFHSANNLASPYTPIKVNSLTSYEPRPVCYGIMAFNAGCKGKLVQINLSGAPATFRAYSVVGSDRKMFVTLINMDANNDVTLTLNPGNNLYTYAEGLRLTGNTLNSAANVSLGGAALDAQGLWSPKNIEKISRSGNAFQVSIPKASAIVITLSPPPAVIPGKFEAESYVDSIGIQSGICEDLGGGKAVGHIAKTDWLEYDLNVSKKGDYTVDFRIASGATASGNIRIKQDGKVIASVPVVNTGGWGVYKTVTIPMKFEKGRRIIRLEFDNAGGDLLNINWVEAKIIPQMIPGKVQTEIYSDSSGIISGSANDLDGTNVIGKISNGDWTQYEVDVKASMMYQVDVRAASASSGGTVHIKSGNALLASIPVTGTGGWGTWKSFTGDIILEEGLQTLRFEYIGGSGDFFNINWLEFREPTITGVDERPDMAMNAGVRVYPNPSAQQFEMQSNGAFSYQLFDLAGHVVLEGSGFDKLNLGERLVKGLYLLKVNKGDQSHFVRLIKE